MVAGERGREEATWWGETMLNIPPWSSPATRKTRLEEEEEEEDQERRQSCWETLSSLLSSGLEESQAARQPPVQNWGKSQREVEVGSSRSSRHSARQDSTSSLARPPHRAWQVAVIRLGSSRVSSSEVEEVEEAGVMRTVRRKTVEVEMVIFMLSCWLLVSD